MTHRNNPISLLMVDDHKMFREVCCSMLSLKPNILVTMHYTRKVINKMMKAGCNGYLTKSASMVEMVNAIITINSGKQYISEAAKVTLTDRYFRNRKNAQ